MDAEDVLTILVEPLNLGDNLARNIGVDGLRSVEVAALLERARVLATGLILAQVSDSRSQGDTTDSSGVLGLTTSNLKVKGFLV